MNGGLAGETQSVVLKDQFGRMQNGDPNWYENKYSADKVDQLNDTSLSDIIARNTGVDNIQDDAMAVRQKDW